MRTFLRLFKDRRGATAIEYALVVTLIFLAMMVGLVSLSQANRDSWNYISTKVGGG